jgi:hypothetical protein
MSLLILREGETPMSIPVASIVDTPDTAFRS